MKDLGLKKNCEIVIVPQNLTNKVSTNWRFRFC